MENIFEFKIEGKTTQKVWAVYVIVATHINDKQKLLYVGKVGDNRSGCNPIISRVGNHFSYNKVHSQLRNKINKTTDFNYEIFCAIFGIYDKKKFLQDRDRINELERQLNKIIHSKVGKKLINIYKGTGYISNEEKGKRKKLLTANDYNKLIELADRATK